MLLGPVFHAELITTARRARYYVVRFGYGLIVLFQIYLSYNSNSYRFNRKSELTLREMADFGRQIFTAFAVVQAVVVLLLTPALVGGTIADERQRKTLHYLLTSELTGFEIVFGKLAARLLHVVVLVALGLPVVSLIGLFGGVDFPLLLLTYAGTLSTVYFLATLSILVSVFSRRPREAISVLYVLEFAWLALPPLLMSWMPYWAAPWPSIYPWIAPAMQYVAITSPFYLISPMSFRNPGGVVTTIFWGMGLQVAYGTIFLILAAFRLRPSSRNEGGHGRLADLSRVLGRRRRWLGRPECGDDAMLWKERFVSRTGGVTKAVMALVGLVIVGLIAYSSYDFLRPAVAELMVHGYSDNTGSARRDFNAYLRGISTGIYVLWMLGVASSAASGLSSEREEDTWLSLTATPLEGREILRAKMIGPVWALRPVAILLFTLWAIGLAVGSIHPVGLVACAVELAVFTWFLTSIGTFFSLRSRNSTRALASTMALLIFVNGGYMVCCIPFRPDTSIITAGSTPVVFTISLASPYDLDHISGRHVGEMITACILSIFLYGIAAAGLTSALFGTFDAVVDRPDRLRPDLTPAQQRERHKGRGKEIIFPDEMA